jgi:hypothetical protein
MGAQPRKQSLVLFVTLAVVALGGGVMLRKGLARPARSLVPAVRAPASRVPGTGGAPGELVLHVPHLAGGVTLDGDTDDPGWTQPPGPARTGPFQLPDGREAHPYSDARLLWGDGHLYLALYASDEDIETRTTEPDGPLWLDDSYRVTFRRPGVEYVIEVSPTGVVTDSIRRGNGNADYSWSSGVHVSPEHDGTINDPSNMDEEWVIEMAVPFESIGLEGEPGESIGLQLRRCDTPKGAPRICHTWPDGDEKGRIVLD